MRFAVLMRKTRLLKNIYIFKPIQIIKGDFVKSDNSFIDEQNKKYRNINDSKYINSNEDNYFSFVSNESYKIDKKPSEIYEDENKYFKKYRDFFVAGVIRNNKVSNYIFDDKKSKVRKSSNLTKEQIQNNDKVVMNELQLYQDFIENCIKNTHVDTQGQVENIMYIMMDFCDNVGKIKNISCTQISNYVFNKLYMFLKIYHKEYSEFYKDKKDLLDNIPVYEQKEDVKMDKEVVNNSFTDKYSISELYQGITKNVVAQDEHILRIVTELYKRFTSLSLPVNKRSKFGMLVTGSTGVGKTEIFNTLAQIVDLPILKVDSTQLTKPGYIGKNIEDYLKELWDQEDGNIDRMERAIILFDEIDKKSSSKGTNTSDISGKAVQDVLLKLMDGTSYNLDKRGLIDTSDMTIISLGAFTDLYHQEAVRPIGINSKYEELEKKDATVSDFEDYGMTSEFIGRHHVVIHLNDLNVVDLERILKTSNISPLLFQQELFKQYNVDVKFTDDYIKEAAREAYQYKSGARALTKVVEETTWMPVIDIDAHRGQFNQLILTKDTFKNPRQYTLRKN